MTIAYGVRMGGKWKQAVFLYTAPQKSSQTSK